MQLELIRTNDAATLLGGLHQRVDVRRGTWRLALYTGADRSIVLVSGAGKRSECERVAAEFVKTYSHLDRFRMAFYRVVEKRILLLVEDTPGDVFLVEELLVESGWAVEVAGSLAEAIACYQNVDPDLVLLDLRLPDSSGEETFLRFTDRCPGATVVVWSDLDDVKVGRELESLGASGYIVKTYLTLNSADKLIKECGEAVERTHSRLR